MAALNVSLLRKDNGDGTSKDWAAHAVAMPNGDELVVWFGRTGTPMQKRIIPRNRWRALSLTEELALRYMEKERKGYVEMGRCCIGDDGTLRMSSGGAAGNSATAPPELPKVVYFELRPDSGGKTDSEGLFREFMRVACRLASELGGTTANAGRSSLLSVGLWSMTITPRLKVAGEVRPEHGPEPFLFLLALKKTAPEGIEVSLARDDGSDVPAGLVGAREILDWFGKTATEAASLAEQLGLVVPIVDKAKAANEPDFYF